MLAHHFSKLEAVEFGHADVDQYDCDLALQQVLQGFAPGRRLDQVVAEVAKNHLVAEQLGRLIVDKQNVDSLVIHKGGCPGSSDGATF